MRGREFKVRKGKNMGEQVKGLAHVAFNVSDMDKAIQFYQDVLGFEKAFDLKNPKTGGALDCVSLCRGESVR